MGSVKTPRTGRASGTTRRAAVPSRDCAVEVHLGSPYSLFELSTVHARALSAVRDVYGLTQGPLALRIDRMITSGADGLDQLFLLRALLLSDDQADYWNEHWESLRALYEIELGTQVLLSPLSLSEPVIALLRALSATGTPTRMRVDWSETLHEVVRDMVFGTAGCSPPPASLPSSQAPVRKETGPPRTIWIGERRDSPSRVPRPDRVAFGEVFGQLHLRKALEQLGLEPLAGSTIATDVTAQDTVATTAEILAFPESAGRF